MYGDKYRDKFCGIKLKTCKFYYSLLIYLLCTYLLFGNVGANDMDQTTWQVLEDLVTHHEFFW